MEITARIEQSLIEAVDQATASGCPPRLAAAMDRLPKFPRLRRASPIRPQTISVATEGSGIPAEGSGFSTGMFDCAKPPSDSIRTPTGRAKLSLPVDPKSSDVYGSFPGTGKQFVLLPNVYQQDPDALRTGSFLIVEVSSSSASRPSSSGARARFRRSRGGRRGRRSR